MMTPEERNLQFINFKKNQSRKITEERNLKDSQIELDNKKEEKEIAELKKAADKYDSVLQGRKTSKLTTSKLTTISLPNLGGKRKTKKNKNKRSRKNKKQNKRSTRHR